MFPFFGCFLGDWERVSADSFALFGSPSAISSDFCCSWVFSVEVVSMYRGCENLLYHWCQPKHFYVAIQFWQNFGVHLPSAKLHIRNRPRTLAWGSTTSSFSCSRGPTTTQVGSAGCYEPNASVWMDGWCQERPGGASPQSARKGQTRCFRL